MSPAPAEPANEMGDMLPGQLQWFYGPVAPLPSSVRSSGQIYVNDLVELHNQRSGFCGCLLVC